MLARIVDRRQRAGAAIATGLVGIVAMIIVILDEAVFSRTILHALGTHLARTLLAAFIATPVVSPLLVRAAKPRRAGGEVAELRADDVRGLSLARAERGWSLAIEHANGKLWFVELESREDARRLVRRLRAGRPNVDGVSIPGEIPALRVVHFVVAAISLFAAVHFATKHNTRALELAFFTALAVAVLTVARVGATQAFRRARPTPLERAAFGTRSAWSRHAWLHLAGTLEDLAALEREDAPAPVLRRGDESTRAWLARIDEIAAKGGGAYRDGLDEGALRTIAVDEDAPIDERMAAARVLKRRIGVTVAAEVKDADARVRIATAESDDGAAADRIDELGPAFRMRAP